MTKTDKTNIAIVRHLRDGRKSFKDVADDLALSENTVRSRVKKLQSENALDICGLLDPQAIPGHSVVFVGVKLHIMDLVRKGE